MRRRCTSLDFVSTNDSRTAFETMDSSFAPVPRAVERFDLRDEKGRTVGVVAWAHVIDRQHGQALERPYVVVNHHATRDGYPFGPSPTETYIGPVEDSRSVAKAQGEIARRIEGTRKRYALKYA